MTEEERLKSDVASRGKEDPASQGAAGRKDPEAVERRARRAQARGSGPDQTEQQPGGGRGHLQRLWGRIRAWVGETEQQPGGGHWSESEKPDSPDSRWGGGR